MGSCLKLVVYEATKTTWLCSTRFRLHIVSSSSTIGKHSKKSVWIKDELVSRGVSISQSTTRQDLSPVVAYHRVVRNRHYVVSRDCSPVDDVISAWRANDSRVRICNATIRYCDEKTANGSCCSDINLHLSKRVQSSVFRVMLLNWRVCSLYYTAIE